MEIEEMEIEEMGQVLGERFEAIGADGALALEELGLPEGAEVLDVGTGNGYFAIYLASRGYHVVTGEPSTDTSRYARRDWASNASQVGVLDRIRFEAFDASRMPFASEAFHAVFFFGVLHHIDAAVRRDVLREALRVSKPGGAVVFFEPGEAMLERLWRDDPDHPHAANPSEYLPDRGVREQRMEGALMDISIFWKPEL